MLLFVVSWTLLIVVSVVIGSTILSTSDGSILRISDRFLLSTWIGITILAVALLGISLFTNLSPITGLITILTLLSIALCSRKTRNELRVFYSHLTPISVLLFFALELIIALFCTQPVTWYDTGLYHFQVIQWLSDFGTLPGLALLHSRFGFTSSWLALASPFNAGIFEMRSSAVTGGLALLLGSVHLGWSLIHIIKGRGRFVDWFVVLASLTYLPPLVSFHNITVSPSPDVPLIPLTLVITWSILIISEHESKKSVEQSCQKLLDVRAIPLILAGAAFGIKLSSLPCLIAAIVFYIIKDFRINRIFVCGIFISLLAAPLLVSSIVTSGCPLFPSPVLCLNRLPWSIGQDQAANLSKIIQEWNQWLGPTPQNALPGEWLVAWSQAEKLSVFLILLSSISIGAIYFLTRKDKIPGQNYVVFIASLGIALMMHSAPAMRFGLGYLCLLPAFLGAIFFYFSSYLMGLSILLTLGASSLWLNPLQTIAQLIIASLLLCSIFIFVFKYEKARHFSQVILISLLCLLSFHSLFNTLKSKNQLPQLSYESAFLPPTIFKPTYSELVDKKINGLSFWSPLPGEDQCWAAELPCSPYVSHDDIRLHSPELGISKGFVRSSLAKP